MTALRSIVGRLAGLGVIGKLLLAAGVAAASVSTAAVALASSAHHHGRAATHDMTRQISAVTPTTTRPASDDATPEPSESPEAPDAQEPDAQGPDDATPEATETPEAHDGAGVAGDVNDNEDGDSQGQQDPEAAHQGSTDSGQDDSGSRSNDGGSSHDDGGAGDNGSDG